MVKYKKPKVVAEIGCNHMGDFEVAKRMIRTAKKCGAYVAKFQKRNPKELLTLEQYNSPHPNPRNAFGKTYGEHREFLEFTPKQHRELKDYCDKIGINYSSSVWDLTSARDIINLDPIYIKIPSASNNNYELLKYIIENYKKDIHISLGMTTKKEEYNIFALFKEYRSLNRLVIYACTSGYPVPFKDINLLEIKRLKEKYGKSINNIGFSGHHLGIAIDIAAYTLGAAWIERHFTLDRTWKGTDQAASLEPQGFKKLVRDLNHTFKALHYKNKEILEIEESQRKKLKFKNE